MAVSFFRWTLAAVFMAASAAQGATPEACTEYAAFGMPGTAGDIVCRKGYLLAHDPYYKTPLWVAEHVTLEKANGTLPHDGRFRTDTALKRGERAEPADYAGCGFERGQMASSTTLAWDQGAMKEAYYLSNVVPQDAGMCRNAWKMLEEKVRQWGIDRGELYVFTGPLYEGDEVEVIGENEVAVPTHLYKVVFDPKRTEAIAFILPNAPVKPSDLQKYIVTVRDVEKKSGLDFLSRLKPAYQEFVETEKAKRLW